MKERKPYTTKNRSEILDYLKKNCSSTISAADIKKHLEEKEISVNTTTIYRFLDKLCAENIIIKYSDVNSDKAICRRTGELPGTSAFEVYKMRKSNAFRLRIYG